MSKHYLKIKIVSLAYEARAIRKEERRVKPTRTDRKRLNRQLKSNELTEAQRARIERKLARAQRIASDQSAPQWSIFWGLRQHRTVEVRREARSAQIAYAYVRGRSYLSVERDAKSSPDWNRVTQLARKYGSPATSAEDLKAWIVQS